jgi:DnaJ-domain-containing protein 1
MSLELIFTVVIMGFIGYTLVGWLIDKLKNNFSKNSKDSTSNFNHSKHDEEQQSSNKNESDWATILGVRPTASNDEIKNAYRALIRQYHPDKVSSLGKEFQEIAELKSKQINNAYDRAKKIRGF